MNLTLQKYLDLIDDAENASELVRLRDEIIPCALLTNAEQSICYSALEERFSHLQPAQTSTLAGDGNAAVNASKLLAPASPTGARFFIRRDGQYMVKTVVEAEEGYRIAGKQWFVTTTRKMRTACLGYKPDGNGEIHFLEDFFLN